MSKFSDQHQILALPVFNYSTSIALIIIASFCFSNSYNGDFVFDDSEAIINNKDVTETPIYEIFQNDFWGTKLSNKKSHKSYRPLTILSFRFHYWSEEWLNPTSFHIVNIILHASVSILTLFVYEILLDWQQPQISFYAAMLFAVHPIHAEAVSGIVGRADILSGLFMWLSLIFYYKCIYSKSLIIQFVHMLLCIINCTMAMFCKETGITILGICFIYDLVIVNNLILADFVKLSRLRTISFRQVHDYIKLNIPLFVRLTVLAFTGVLLLILRLKIMGFSKPVFKPVDNPASFLDSFFIRVLNYNYIYFLNFWLLLCPEWLCFDWSMGCIPLIENFDVRIIFILLFWIFLSLFGIILFSRKDYKIVRYITIGMALLVIPFLPASNLFFTVGFVVAERTLYIPSAGYCLLLMLGFKKLTETVIYQRIISTCLGALLLIFFIRSWIRSAEWKTETTLFQSGLQVCPLNAKVHYNIGKNAADRGMIDFAKIEYQEAIKLNPNYSQAMNNLGNLYRNDNDYQIAEKLLRKALKLQNDFPAAWMNLGIVLSHSNKYEEAEKCYQTAISQRSNYPDCYYNLGLLYLSKKNYESALNAWKTATNQKLSHRQAWINMIILYDDLRKSEEALKVGERALSYLPEDPSIHFNLGNISGKQKKFIKAEYHFKKALSVEPNNSNYYTNLGVLYHYWEKYDEAEKMYKKALEINPNSKTVEDNLRKLYKKWKKTLL